MDQADSIYVRECQRRLGDILSIGRPIEEADVIAIENDVLRNADIIPMVLRDEVERTLAAAVGKRQQAQGRLIEDLSRVWGSAFEALERCTAFADFLCARLLNVTGRRYDELRTKDPRPRPGADDSVTGAPLKCVALISLNARSCSIASEILYLLRHGFLGAAQSRLRSLHEQTVVITVLCNDHTYELAERYHDHACYEYLKQLRAYKQVSSDSVWRVEPETFDLTQEIAAVEKDVREARLRWGPEIGEQYGWARPAIAGGNSRRRPITFSDLEKVAEADFLRGDYLVQNHEVHAGSYAAINQLMTKRLNTIGIRDDETTWLTGSRTVVFLHFSSQVVCKAVSWETEEYDEMLYACAMNGTAASAIARFDECYDRCSTSN